MIVFERPNALTDRDTHYCPGCTHGVIHRLVAEVIDELEIGGRTIGVAPVGCAVMAYDYFACDMVEAARTIYWAGTISSVFTTSLPISAMVSPH